MTYVLWENLFKGDPTRIKKALFGSVLFRDWNGAATSMSTYSPFDPTTGNLSSTILTTDGWYDSGLVSENGVSFTPKYTTVETMAWQSRLSQRTDVTIDQEEIAAEFMQATPLIDALREQIPLTNLPTVGTTGYTITKPITPQTVYRQMMVLGVDGSQGANEYFGAMFPRVLMVKPEKVDYNSKTATLWKMTFDSYLDPYSAFAVRRFREGPMWRASGGTTSTPGTPVAVAVAGGIATLTFTPPTSLNGPFIYNVNQTLSSTTTAVSGSNLTVVSQSPTSVVLRVAGLTPPAGSYTFVVQATGANGSQSVPSAASNAITSLS